MFDNGNNEINKMFEKIGNSLDILDIPKYENDKTNEKSDVEKLNDLISVQDKLEKKGYCCDGIKKQINSLLNKMNE